MSCLISDSIYNEVTALYETVLHFFHVYAELLYSLRRNADHSIRGEAHSIDCLTEL